MTPEEEQRQIAQIKARLSAKFPSATRQTVDDAVNKANTHFADKNIRDFVPLLVERRANETLTTQVAT
ncbi:three-helix bundle dimerization domain-containing protein [Rhodococcus globerulus]|uniref:Uncharacterized protein n=1 Tax=Rhodococcus globerulus TaxID=33008 RepID=A0ABU4C5G6_RHOGO|nr:hypothetical protein [Rhodococcus globerulus]MDV6271742.1 hypothetical protein [Rhodococcus globerulus]